MLLHQIVSVFNFYYVNWNFLGAKFNELNRSLNYKFTQLVHILNQESNFSLWDGDLRFEPLRQCKAECCSWWKIILPQERTHCSEKRTKRKDAFLRILEEIGWRSEWIGLDISLKECLKSGTCSYYPEHVLSQKCISNQECVLNHLEIIKWPPPSKPAP